MTLEERVEKLETALSEANGVTIHEMVCAKRFALMDEKRTPRAGLKTNKDGTELVLTDGKGNPRAVLRLPKKGPRLDLVDETGNPVWSAP